LSHEDFQDEITGGNSMKTGTVLVLMTRLVMGGVIGASLLIGAPHARAEEYTKSFTVSGRASVRVDTNDGSVQVMSGDAESRTVQVRVMYQGFQLDRDLRIDARQDGDRVELVARSSGMHFHFGWSKDRNLRIEVRMPKAGDLQVSTGDGAVEASDLSGNINVTTGDGSVKGHDLTGTVDLHTGDGSISVDGLRGDIRLRTGDGSIEARGLDGKVNADSGDGHIKLEGRFDGLNIRTGDGSVEARVGSGSKVQSGWNVHTGDGSVDVTLPGDLQANIDASTGDGHISMGLPVTVEGSFSNSQIHGKMNGGGQPLVIHTSDGSIRVNKS
jgi:Putative adhesin